MRALFVALVLGVGTLLGTVATPTQAQARDWGWRARRWDYNRGWGWRGYWGPRYYGYYSWGPSYYYGGYPYYYGTYYPGYAYGAYYGPHFSIAW
jgi:hypothetical protein